MASSRSVFAPRTLQNQRETRQNCRGRADAGKRAEGALQPPRRRGSSSVSSLLALVSARRSSRFGCSRSPILPRVVPGARVARTPYWRDSTVVRPQPCEVHGPNSETALGRQTLRRTPLTRSTRGRTDTVDAVAQTFLGVPFASCGQRRCGANRVGRLEIET